MTIPVDSGTKYFRGDKPAALGDIRVGGRVVVTASEEAGAMKVLEVHLSAPKTEP